MDFHPSPEALTELFARVVPADGDVTRRKMFGWPAAFVGGNMFAGLHREALIVRLPEADLEALQALGGRPFEPMPGRPMKGYAVVPDDLLADEPELARWLERALAHGRSLPPKR
jgi:TfoX/Sxy family transcriptional regulator of competence genes